MTIKPCRYCGKEPEVVFHPLPFLCGCWHIACRNDECKKNPSTWYYYDSADAKAEWEEMMGEVDA